MYAQFLKLTGLIDMSSTNQIILVSLVLIIMTILGFLSDHLMRTAGFGPIGNIVLLLLGLIGGAIAYTLYLKVYRHQYPYLSIAMPIVASFGALFIMAVLKAVFRR